MQAWTWEWLRVGVTNWQTGIFTTLWILVNLWLFIIGYLEQRNDPGLSRLNRPIGTSIYFSRGAGLVLMFNGMLILLPVCRNIISLLRMIKPLRSIITFDKNIHFHKMIAWTMLAFTGVHLIAHVINFAVVEATGLLDNRSAINLLWTHPAGITGVVMLACMILIYTSAMAPIRHQSFELFWYLHHLAFPFMIALLLHSSGCFVKLSTGSCKPYGTWQAASIGLGIYVFERLLRMYRSRQVTYLTKVIQHPSKTIEIQFKKRGFTYLPGQYIFVNVPEISKYEWHPFTLTSTPEEDFVGLHIRIMGDWTEKFARRLGYFEEGKELKQNEGRLTSNELPEIKIDGPFGAPSQQVFDYEQLILVGAGIGVTPFASILKHLWYQYRMFRNNGSSKNGWKLKKVTFIWIARETEAFQWFQSLLAAIEDAVNDGFLEISLYLTGKMSKSIMNNIIIQANDSKDAITNLRSRTNFGRPDFQQIFQDYKLRLAGLETGISLSQAEQRLVGVFFCGPDPIKLKIREASNKLSDQSVRFEVYSEKFS